MEFRMFILAQNLRSRVLEYVSSREAGSLSSDALFHLDKFLTSFNHATDRALLDVADDKLAKENRKILENLIADGLMALAFITADKVWSDEDIQYFIELVEIRKDSGRADESEH